jgi:ferredoxin, 2Fe-2S
MPKTVSKAKPSADKLLVFQPGSRACSFTGRPSILEVALANNIDLGHSCGGMGSCTTCRVFVEKGVENLGTRNEVEAEHAQMRGYKQNERLSCQTEAFDGLVVRIPDDIDIDPVDI